MLLASYGPNHPKQKQSHSTQHHCLIKRKICQNPLFQQSIFTASLSAEKSFVPWIYTHERKFIMSIQGKSQQTHCYYIWCNTATAHGLLGYIGFLAQPHHESHHHISHLIGLLGSTVATEQGLLAPGTRSTSTPAAYFGILPALCSLNSIKEEKMLASRLYNAS